MLSCRVSSSLLNLSFIVLGILTKVDSTTSLLVLGKVISLFGCSVKHALSTSDEPTRLDAQAKRGSLEAHVGSIPDHNFVLLGHSAKSRFEI